MLSFFCSCSSPAGLAAENEEVMAVGGKSDSFLALEEVWRGESPPADVADADAAEFVRPSKEEAQEEERHDGETEGDPQERERAAARSVLKSAARHRGPESLEVLRLALARARAAGLADSECWAVLDLLGNLAVPGKWEEVPSGDARSEAWCPLPAEWGRAADRGLYIFRASGKGRRLTIADGQTVDFQLMTCSKQRQGSEKPLIIPVRRQDSATGQQTHPEPDSNHPWLARRVSLREVEGDWLTNDFFWTAFKKCLSDGGEMVDARVEELFDFQHNFDYRGWTGAEEEVRGGIKYKIPKGWKRFACRVKNKFGQDNRWLRLDGGAGEWAVAYHGTSYAALAPILHGGLKAGNAQAYKKNTDVRTGEVIGSGVYCTPSIDVAIRYARSRGGTGGTVVDGKSVYFVMQCRVKPDAIKRCHDENEKDEAYWVVNDPADIRPYGVLVRKADSG